MRAVVVSSLLLTLAAARLWWGGPQLVAGEVDPLDWTSWRGPYQNGVSLETGLVDSWSPDGENLIWANEEMGGISTPIVMHGRVYMINRAAAGTPEEGERVVCADAATGETLWENRFNVFSSDVPGERVGWASLVGDPVGERIYAQGVGDLFLCIDANTGETVWSRSLSEELGFLSTYGGRTNTPVLFDDLVITSSVVIGWGDKAKPSHQLVAMDKNTGEIVWFNGTRPLPDDTTYSTPVIAVINGQALMIFGSGDGGVYAFQPRTGKEVWNYQFSRRGLNVSPIVDEAGRVYMGQSEENMDDVTMGAVVALDGTLTGDLAANGGELWIIKELMVGKSSPLLVDGKLYVAEDRGGLDVVDVATGQTLLDRPKKLGTVMRASLLYADGKIYANEANGRLWILRPGGPDGVEVVHTQRLKGDSCNGSPIVSHGRIYIPTGQALYCIGDPDAETGVNPAPPQPQEAPVTDDPEPAWVQVVPAEALVRPGDEIDYRVRLFNARGQRVDDAPAEFSVAGGGQIDASTGTFTAEDQGHYAVTVTAKVGDLSGSARVRVVPDLPWQFDFSAGEVPITWVGARYRHQIRDVDGNPVMVKVTTIPKGTRSQAFMGQTDLHDYTIEADVRGSIRDDKMPDIGLVAQRYTFDMMGASRQLQIRTWAPQLRMAVNVPFEWQPDVWYRMKLRAENQDVVAVISGKVWPRDEPEPDEWTITATDTSPNRVGSPGLFGNATDAEIFLDNIVVYPNEDAAP
ncbi:MAG: PQQ-binding-like beta-propeller repeat protein [Pirellulales bacterium]